MAIRQYIGARYVTKIYENSLNPSSAEWESGYSYEPLTLVTYLNGSYLSKKAVPGSVGDPASNPTYWVQTGFYNGQIASLQAQIDDINNNTIPPIENTLDQLTQPRRFIFIGDSYDNIAAPTKWSSVVINKLGLSDSVVCSYGQTGFIANITWLSKLQAEVISDEETITDIVICGGANDSFKTLSDLPSAMQTFDTYCRTRFTGLKNIYLGFVGQSLYTSNQFKNMRTCARYYINQAATLGWRYLNGIENTLLFSDYMQEILPNDYIHPNANGVTKIGENIVSCLQTGSCLNRHGRKTVTWTTNSAKVNETTFTFTEGMNDNTLTIVGEDKNFTSATSLSGFISAFATCPKLSNMYHAGYMPASLTYSGSTYKVLLIPSDFNSLTLALPSGLTIPSGATFSLTGWNWLFDLNY